MADKEVGRMMLEAKAATRERMVARKCKKNENYEKTENYDELEYVEK